MAHYRIRANSLGRAFLECLELLPPEPFGGLHDLPETTELRRHADEYPPLAVVASFLDRLGEVVTGMLAAHPACRVVRGLVKEIHLLPDGARVRVDASSGLLTTTVGQAVIATGGRPMADFRRTSVVGDLTLDRYADKLSHSESLLDLRRPMPPEQMRAIRQSGHAAVVGGAHSAWAVAALLLADPELRGPAGEPPMVTILHRSPVRLFYLSARHADADNYPFDPQSDVCPASGRINRFGGLRGPAFDLARAALGLAGAPVPVSLVDVSVDEPVVRAAAIAALDAAGAVIVATGYEANLPRIIGEDGAELVAACSPTGTVVTSQTQLLDQHGTVHPQLLAFGLGAGLPPSDAVGGESSYHRRADGVWLYQNDIGHIVLDQLLAGLSLR